MTAEPRRALDDFDWRARLTRMRQQRVVRLLRLPVGTVVTVAAMVIVSNLCGLSSPYYVIALGALIGISYGLLGVCLALIFRVSRVINFAQPAIGLFALSFMPLLVQVLHLPWWLGFAAIAPVGFITGAVVEAVVIRRLYGVPRVVGVVASLGVAGVLASATGYVQQLGSSSLPALPAPPGLPSFTVGPLLVSSGYTGLIISAPLLTAALAWFLTRTRYGLAVLASAGNPENAKLSGISPALVSGLAWGLAGLISTIATVFFLGTPPANPTASVFSPPTLLPALGAAAIGAFTSLPRALTGGIVIGIAQQIMLWSPESARYGDLAPLVLLFVALLFGHPVSGRGDPFGSWTAVSGWRPLPAPLARLWPVRHYGRALLGLVLAYLIFAATRNDVSAQTWTVTLCIAVVSLSAALVTGLGGELSLGQFGFAVFGAGVSFVVVRDTGNFAAGLGCAAAAGGAMSLLLAYPSLRTRGLTLTILTLAFAIAVPTVFLTDPHVFGSGFVTPQQPVLGGTAIRTGVPYFFLALAMGALCSLLAWNVWRGGFGRIVRAGRDNEPAAQSFGLRVLGSKLKLLFITGALAATAGAVLVHSYAGVTASSFPTDINVRVVLAVVMGGLSILYGGPLGVLWLFASAVAQSTSSASSYSTGADQAASLAIYSSALILILISPGGAAQLLEPVRDAIAVGVGRLFGVRYTLAQIRGEKRLETPVDEQPGGDPTSPGGHQPATAPPPPAVPRQRTLPTLRAIHYPPSDPATTLLECHSLQLRFGAVTAVDGLDLTVDQGEILGLIGPNGAGKTSTFEMISGFRRPTAGSVTFDGRDITALPPHRRADVGLIRSFQDAQLFPTLSTVEVITLALERQRPTSSVSSILGVDLTVRRRRQVAEEIIDFFGLGPYRGSRIRELSTGTRRFVELAALIAMRPRLLLLDEPSSGIAQRESEALGPLLCELRREFDLTMIVIEHDIPLIMSISDRVLAMAEGRCLLVGNPAEVRADPRVIDAYLGGSLDAINRSDQPVGGRSTTHTAHDQQEGQRTP